MVATVSLAAKMAKYRQLRVLIAQRRHLRARFSAVFGDLHVQTLRLNTRHFEGAVYYPLSKSCKLRVASAIAESSTDAIERVHGAALSVVNSPAALHHLLQAVDSDVFVEFCATLDSMGATSVIHLLRDPCDGDVPHYMVTVSVSLPLKDSEIPDAGSFALHCNNMTAGNVAVCRSSGRFPRDAVKRGCALALAELDAPAVNELCSREEESMCFLKSVLHDSARRDWDGGVLSAFLSSSMHNEGSPAQPLLSLSLSLSSSSSSAALNWNYFGQRHNFTFSDVFENETDLTLFSPPLPSAFARGVLKDGKDSERSSSRFFLQSSLEWPLRHVVSAPLVQLCNLLNTWEQISVFDAAATLSNCGFLPLATCHSVERGMFLVNALVAASFLRLGSKIGCILGSEIPLICLKSCNSTVGSSFLELEVIDGKGKYAEYASRMSRLINSKARRIKGGHERGQENHVQKWETLVHVWELLAATGAIVGARSAYRDILAWSPALTNFTFESENVRPLFARDAQLTGSSTDCTGLFLLSSTSLGLVDFPLRCYASSPACVPQYETMGSSINSNFDAQRVVADSTWKRDSAQSLFYCPDVLLMVHEMRLALHLPQSTFPVIEFYQSAQHNVPRRVLQISRGEYGDVPVHTRIVAHWGPNLRVEVAGFAGNEDDDNTHEKCGEAQREPLGPLRLLFSAVCALYARVFPRRVATNCIPVIPLTAPNTRHALDFLLYAWFDGVPQVRCFNIDIRSARLALAAQSQGNTAEKILAGIKDDYIVRAMLFYDILGQRILLAETHARTPWAAIAQVRRRAIAHNAPQEDYFPVRQSSMVSEKNLFTRSHTGSKLDVLLSELESASRARIAVAFVRHNFGAVVEGIVEVRLKGRQWRHTAEVTVSRGVIPALAAACRAALREVLSYSEGDNISTDDMDITETMRMGPILPWDDFPHFSARFYTATNLLGETLRDMGGKYQCSYTIDSIDGDVICELYVQALAGRENVAAHTFPFVLGVGRGRGKREAWSAAALSALQANFPTVLEQVERHKRLSSLLHSPLFLARAGCPDGFDVSLEHCENGEFRCKFIALRDSVKKEEEEKSAYITKRNETTDGKDPSGSTDYVVVERCARDGVTAYLSAADALLEAARVGSSLSVPSLFASWDPTSNYGKSAWHACCGAIGVALGGKLSLCFDGDALTGVPLRARLVHRSHDPAEARDRSATLIPINVSANASTTELLGATTRALAQVVRTATNGETRHELRRLLMLLRRLRDDGRRCRRLSSARRVEAELEITLGCQCRVAISPDPPGGVVARAGVWLPGWASSDARVPFLLLESRAAKTVAAVTELEGRVRQVVDGMWDTLTETYHDGDTLLKSRTR